jgi:Short C-terminal domain
VGLFSRRSKDAISGTAQVISSSYYRGDAAYQSCHMELVVTAEGLAPYSVGVDQIVSRKKWPQPGLVVPVTVSASNPRNVKVDFSSLPTGRDRARAIAEQQAAFLRGETPPAGGALSGLAAANVQFVGGTIDDVPPEKLAKLEAMLGIDLDGDGTIGANDTPGYDPSSTHANDTPGYDGTTATDDRIGQLERLAQLHASGALTDDEFAAEKRRILGT